MTSKTQRLYESKNLRISGYMFFQDMKKKGEFCDIIFRIGGKNISGHRIVIAAAIPYYRGVLNNKDAANEKNVNEFIMADDIDPAVFKNIIDFAYNGKVIITNENVKCLLRLALQLNVNEIIDACCDYLADYLTTENVFNTRDFAAGLECATLLRSVDDFICENFSEICQTDKFCNLPLQCVEELLSRDDLRVSSEEKVFVSVMKWVKKCPEQRKTNLPELLKKVRMTLLDPLYLKTDVARESLIHESILCRDLLDEARDYHFFPEWRSLDSAFSCVPRSPSSTNNERTYVISVSSDYTAQFFDHQKQKWEVENHQTSLHTISSTAVVGTKIYYIHLGQIMSYDPSANVLKHCKPLPREKSHCEVLSMNGKIYLCGGTSYSKTVLCYDPEKNAWEDVNDMQEYRYSPGATTLAECIYVLGGSNKTSVLRSAEKFDLNSGKWRAAPSMLTERKYFGCTTLNGRIYVCGGIKAGEVYTLSAEKYDPVENNWVFISSMNTPRCFFKLLPCRGKLFAVGGTDPNNSELHNVEIYCPSVKRWIPGNEMNSLYFAAAGLSNLPYS